MAGLLPSDLCLRRLIAPLGVEADRLRLAMANPLDYPTIQEVEFRTGKHVVGVVASEAIVRTLLVRLGLAVPATDEVDELRDIRRRPARSTGRAARSTRRPRKPPVRRSSAS